MNTLKGIGVHIIKLKNRLVYKRKIVKGISAASDIPAAHILEYNDHRLLGYQPMICNAPVTSLYFSFDGTVLACCKNRSYKLGHIQQDSIKAIWNGQNRNLLLDKLRQYDFSSGCQGCAQGICAGKYSNVMAASYDTFDVGSPPDYPLRMDFELSSTCNLACVMCDGHLSSTYRKHFHRLPPKDEKYDASFVDQLTEFIPHLKKANFLGGEPFLIDLYYQIWDKLLAVNPSCSIHLQTNGHILNHKVKDVLKKGRFSLGLSLESLKKEKFESIRLFGSYDKFMQHFKFFKEYCAEKGTYFNLAITPLRSTVDELYDFVAFANEQHVPLYFNTVTEPHELALWTLSSKELDSIVKTNENSTISKRSAIEMSNANQFYSFLNQVRQWHSEALEREKRIVVNATKSKEELLPLVKEKCLLYFEQYPTDATEKYAFLQFFEHYLNTLMTDAVPFAASDRLLFYSVIDPERVIFDVMKRYKERF